MEDVGYKLSPKFNGLNFEQLSSLLDRWKQPFFLEMKMSRGHYTHVIGVIRKVDASGVSAIHVVDGAHTPLKTMPFSKETLDWVCGGVFEKTAGGFAFAVGRKLRKKLGEEAEMIDFATTHHAKEFKQDIKEMRGN